MKTMKQLLDTYPRQGEIIWIGLRPERRAPMLSVDKAEATTESGLLNDRYSGRSGDRHVTLIQAEHLPVIASCVGLPLVTPDQLRRNLVVAGLNLLSLKNRSITIGSVELEITGLCHPCSRMEQIFGEGGYNAVRGHGGITARVTASGIIAVGDAVSIVPLEHD
ncbi:molybdenum cofactor sulfurase [Chromatiales bacterium (ex Bugula neritina AB1)]|nr:molybdenum cofactor sulfurase [Chromatiales bacterium (ex Bugula neritina AB1)]